METKQIIKRALRYIVKGVPVKIVKADIHYTLPSDKLKGKSVIITGGGRGLGFAMAKRFASEGAKVLIAGRNEEILRQSAEVIGCQYLCLDMQDPSSFASFIRQAAEMLGNLNCLVNNAGISLHEDGFLSVSQEQYDSQFDTNLKGPFFLTQAFVEYCKCHHAGGTKKVLFTSSETGTTVDERPYGLSKAALNSLVQGLAYRYVGEGYRINAIAPGVTLSDMVGKKDEDNLALIGAATGRYYLPDEIAEVASFLLSDASNCLNGQILVCNEGKTINARWK